MPSHTVSTQPLPTVPPAPALVHDADPDLAFAADLYDARRQALVVLRSVLNLVACDSEDASQHPAASADRLAALREARLAAAAILKIKLDGGGRRNSAPTTPPGNCSPSKGSEVGHSLEIHSRSDDADLGVPNSELPPATPAPGDPAAPHHDAPDNPRIEVLMRTARTSSLTRNESPPALAPQLHAPHRSKPLLTRKRHASPAHQLLARAGAPPAPP